MQESLDKFINYARDIWRYRWPVLAASWFVCVTGWLFVTAMPDKYEAKARVQVDTDSMLTPLLRGLAVQTDINVRLKQMTTALLSRPTLEKIAHEAELDLNVKTAHDREVLLKRLERTIKVDSRRRSNLYSISYIDTDRLKAKKVVDIALNMFVESNLGDSRQDTEVAQRFIDNQIQIYEFRLVEAEERLKEFKRENFGLMPSDGKGYYERLAKERLQFKQAELALAEVVNRRDELKKQLADEVPTVDVTSPLVASTMSHPLDDRILSLENELDNLHRRFTRKHPDVVALKVTIAEYQAKRLSDLTSQSQGSGRLGITAVETNPVYQQLKISLGESEADVASLRIRTQEFKKRVAELEQRVDTIPQVEAKLIRLNRDYSIQKKQYEEFLKRRESAQLSEDVEKEADNLKFKIIDPAYVPINPLGPNRIVFITAVLLGGIGAGIGIGFVLSRVRPVYYSENDLEKATGFPVLGQIGVASFSERVWVDRVSFVTFPLLFVLLIFFYGALVALQVFGMDPLKSLTNVAGLQ